MITSCRSDQLQHEGLFAEAVTDWLHGETGPHAVAASRIVAETVLYWRLIMRSKITQE
jgi:hypothetical protein